jgi:hypothetical protein
MAVLAAALQDGRDVFREGDLIWDGTRRGVERMRRADTNGRRQKQAQPQGEFPGSRYFPFHREHSFTNNYRLVTRIRSYYTCRLNRLTTEYKSDETTVQEWDTEIANVVVLARLPGSYTCAQ